MPDQPRRVTGAVTVGTAVLLRPDATAAEAERYARGFEASTTQREHDSGARRTPLGALPLRLWARGPRRR